MSWTCPRDTPFPLHLRTARYRLPAGTVRLPLHRTSRWEHRCRRW